MRLLVLILGRNTAPSIERFLSSLEPQFSRKGSTELLMVDDASTDDTVKIVQKFKVDHDFSNLRVIQTSNAQGYGGNQKVGFRYALDKGFESIVVLNAAKTYSTTALGTMNQIMEKAEADVFLGIAEKVRRPHFLSMLQNKLAGTSLVGWHSLYKGYRAKALGRVAFELNANDPSFETELLLQLADQKCLISTVRLSIPKGDPAVQPQGIASGGAHLKACLRYRLQKYNLFYDLRYHPDLLSDASQLEIQHTPYSEKLDMNSPHAYVCRNTELISSGSRVLDIGCSTGYVAAYLTKTKNCRVVGVDQLPASLIMDKSFVYHQIDLENDFERLRQILEHESFDVILMLDVLEHLALPELFLLQLRKIAFRKPPRIVFSTGNVAFIVIRLMLFFGYFNYGQKGILDVTHKRLFSLRTFKNLFDQTGFIILKRIGFPLPYRALGFPKGISRVLEIANTLLIKIRRSLFAYQIMFVTAPLALPEQVLAESLSREPERLSGR